jgi:hypothetical protein
LRPIRGGVTASSPVINVPSGNANWSVGFIILNTCFSLAGTYKRHRRKGKEGRAYERIGCLGVLRPS